MLRDVISDSHPTVVANAIASLSEILEIYSAGVTAFTISKSVLQKLLAALNECNEWGQCFHANSAVVLLAVKVIMTFLEKVSDADTERSLINLIVQKSPAILANEIKQFFCKYIDPVNVKMEMLESIICIVSQRNIEQVLLEFKEYATEVDVEFVHRSVRAIGRWAVKLERAAEKCINVLLELIQTKVNYILQEAIMAIKDIFRKYSNQYESIFATLCENLDTLDEPEAKASIIWIIGDVSTMQTSS
ncbi:unnamed protein product [Peronospora farinosa]|nr:unnamed protein product [Peronospora farinosa]